MMKEFKEFAMRGNVVDMAVGVVIGGAFGKIVSSLVGDIIMPLVGAVTGKLDFSKLAFDVKNPVNDELLASIAYGKTITSVIDFIIVAFCIFMVIKAMNAAKRQPAPEPAAPPPPTKDQELLTEIRDILKSR
ncbi:MAG: large-conductance mechanosensitive channel protein MscL [Planctomycetes bacterium]|nr:large-conductance mechanosensitive channel protein MscL [Planctomycetota bacterium]